MRLDQALLAASVVAALFACSAVEGEGSDVVRARHAVSDPMASFARLVGGEWRLEAPGLKGQMFDTWHWGPGRRSVRVRTDGTAASGDPWHEMRVYYWHPQRKEIRLLGLSPFGRGVSDGWIRFDGETAHGVFDLDQIYGHRDMGLQWTFKGPDAYHDVLLEATGAAGLEWMNAWDHVRSSGPPAARTRATGAAPEPSLLPPLVASLVGRTWEARAASHDTAPLHVRSTFDYVPYADGVHARVSTPSANGESAHLFDAYVYHHTGKGRVRALALSEQGGVYDGDVDVLADGALELVLNGFEGDRVVPLVVRFDLENGAALRVRVWSNEGAERVARLDVRCVAIERADD